MKTRIYRDSTGRLDWQMTMAREWAMTEQGWASAGGGWIRRQNGEGSVVCQGWGSVYAHFKAEILNYYTKRLTGFSSFAAMVKAAGTYRPTLLAGGNGGWRYEALAEAYDLEQSKRNDPRRAYRGRRAS
jgi:hypothetical protein